MKGKLPTYRKSFFMSPERKDGLQLEMFYEDGCVYTDFFIHDRFEGYVDVVHGGMTFGVLDTIIWSVIFVETKKIAMTKKVEMEFFKPILCNTHYKALGKVISVEGRDIRAEAWIEDVDGEIYARVDALFREAKGIDLKVLMDRFDFSPISPEIRDFYMSIAEQG